MAMAMADGKPSHSSLGELAPRGCNESNMLSVSTLARYRLLKDAVRRSYRKGKDFLLAEKQRLTQSLNISRDQSNQTEGDLDSSSYYASFHLDSLLNESMTTREQLAQAVSICRQMPELEISAEMVEAERLLLFSSLRKKTLPVPASEMSLAARRQSQCFLIDGLRLPVKADVSQDMFFNYYYICTVECEGRIRSTQSIECQNGAAVFRDCGLEFYSEGPAEALELRCQIFMLRLRKVSTLSLEPPKTLLVSCYSDCISVCLTLTTLSLSLFVFPETRQWQSRIWLLQQLVTVRADCLTLSSTCFIHAACCRSDALRAG